MLAGTIIQSIGRFETACHIAALLIKSPVTTVFALQSLEASKNTEPIVQGKLGWATKTVLSLFIPKKSKTSAVVLTIICQWSASCITSFGIPEVPPETEY